MRQGAPLFQGGALARLDWADFWPARPPWGCGHTSSRRSPQASAAAGLLPHEGSPPEEPNEPTDVPPPASQPPVSHSAATTRRTSIATHSHLRGAEPGCPRGPRAVARAPVPRGATAAAPLGSPQRPNPTVFVAQTIHFLEPLIQRIGVPGAP
jgi:hypothetical protein